MRQAIGTTWIFSICLTFIVLFTAYLAISINYAKAFKIKNHIISMIEENEGIDDDNASSFNTKVEDYLLYQGYDAKKVCNDGELLRDDLNKGQWKAVTAINDVNGKGKSTYYCVYKRNVENKSECSNEVVYKVITFFKFDIPALNTLMVFNVSGNTKVIHDFSNNSC